MQNVTAAAFPVLAVNIGSVQAGTYKGKEAHSGIGKSSVAQGVVLSELGLTGDEQADLVNHGGSDKAVCVYCHNHYPHWEMVLKQTLNYGSFGENFTVFDLTEDKVHIGDIYDIGTAVVQVSQPRQPCWKLAMKWGLDELPLLITNTGATGYYFRVLRPGEVKAGDKLLLKETHSAQITIAEANRVMYKDREDLEGIRRLLNVEELSVSWVEMLTSRLKRLM